MNILESNKLVLNHILDDISPTYLSGDMCFLGKNESWSGTNKTKIFYKVSFVEKGAVSFKIKDKEFCVKSGEMFLIPANIEHTYSDKYGDFTLHWCHFDPGVDLFKLINYSTESLLFTPPFERTLNLMINMNKLSDDNSVSANLRKKSYLTELLSIYFDAIQFNSSNDSYYDNFINIMQVYICRKYAEEITLEDLAKQVSLHPVYFIKIFKKYFFVPPMKYVNMIRLENAAKLLVLEPNKTIEKIAELNGFKDYRYFIRAFKKQYLVSPSVYRNIKNNKYAFSEI